MALVEVRPVDGKGSGTFATAPIKAGDVIISELPILLYPQHSGIHQFCAHCLRSINVPGAQPTPCTGCSNAIFCSSTCASAATSDPGSHCPLVCKTVAACNLAGLSDDDTSSIHYLIRCSSMILAALQGNQSCATRCQTLQSLAMFPHTTDHNNSTIHRQELHGRVVHALHVALNDPSIDINTILDINTAVGLLERDSVNGYGILAPLGNSTDRVLRGTGLYAACSRVNHDCLPNVARCDAFDDLNTSANTAITLRALHAIPVGEEVTQSYCPLLWSYQERQQKSREEYGFECRCQRCRLEASWEESGDEDMDHECSPSCQHHHHNHQTKSDEEGMTEGYIHTFLTKFVCPNEECQGTLCPLSAQPDVSECNICCLTRTDAEFQQLLEHESDSFDE